MKNTINFSIVLVLCAISYSCKKNNAVVSDSLGTKKAITNATGGGTQWYVAANGLTTNDGRSTSTPKGNLREVAALTHPGDVVNIMSSGGIFTRIGQSGVILATTVSGTPGNEITFKGYPAGGTKPVICGYSMFNAVDFNNVSYIILDGIEVIGDKTGTHGGPVLTQAGANTVATNTRNYYVANGNNLDGYAWTDPEIAYQTSGIGASNGAHHITIKNCLVHDMPGSGIGSKGADYVTIDSNIVYNCANYSVYAVSGLGSIGNINVDSHSAGGYTMYFRGNKSYNNSSRVNYYVTGALSDGNGMILDVTPTTYTGKTLVENNIVYNNGGGGIHMVTAQNADVRNNTCYNNGQVVPYAEMDASYASKNINFWSNILYAKNGGKCIANSYTTGSPNVNIVFYKNVMYNSGTPITAITNVNGLTNTDFRTTNPNFYNPGSDFRINTGSSAANFGSGISGRYSLKDFVGVTRILDAANGKYPDCGVYENFN